MSEELRKRVEAQTAKKGGEWALQHARRLIRLVEIVGEGLDYNPEVICLAAHMHDWGTFPGWAREDVTHTEQSCVLAQEYLRKWKCDAATREAVVEAIRYHHGGADERSLEAVLMRDADALDGMGTVGVLREFAMIPTEEHGCYTVPVGWGIRGAYERSLMRLENNLKVVRLPKSKQLGQQKARAMRRVLEELEQETYGCF
jgi:HD superfamily phosphodiesterase